MAKLSLRLQETADDELGLLPARLRQHGRSRVLPAELLLELGALGREAPDPCSSRALSRSSMIGVVAAVKPASDSEK